MKENENQKIEVGDSISVKAMGIGIAEINKKDLTTILEGAVYFQLAQLYGADEMSIPCATREKVKDAIVKEFWERYNNYIGQK